jgi:hypothetical protein
LHARGKWGECGHVYIREQMVNSLHFTGALWLIFNTSRLFVISKREKWRKRITGSKEQNVKNT